MRASGVQEVAADPAGSFAACTSRIYFASPKVLILTGFRCWSNELPPRADVPHGNSPRTRAFVAARMGCPRDAATTSVRAEGLEPSRSFEHRHLKPARMPFRHARER